MKYLIAIFLVTLAVFGWFRLRPTTIEVILPDGYVGEVYIIYGNEREKHSSSGRPFIVPDDGILFTDVVPSGEAVYTQDMYIHYASSEERIPISFSPLSPAASEAAKEREITHADVVHVMSPAAWSSFSYTSPTGKRYEFENGYFVFVVDSLKNRFTYDRNIKDHL